MVRKRPDNSDYSNQAGDTLHDEAYIKEDLRDPLRDKITAEYRSLPDLEQRVPSYQSKGYIVLFYLISLGGNIGSVCVCNFNLIESHNDSISVSH